MIPRHIRSAADLVTSSAQTRKGFLIQALRKTDEATPYVKQAKALWEQLSKAESIETLLSVRSIRAELVAAAGFSDKATKYFSARDLHGALAKVLQKIKTTSGKAWRDNILYRFLLTKGDSLGGAMRNIVGSAAAVIFTESLLAALEAAGILPQVDRSPANNEKLVAVSWPTRLILFDRKPKIIGKNVDVILLDSTGHADSVRSLLARPERYLACGELKGGIDPAGADEHWKTASGALERIRTALAGMNVRLFFVGAAIEDSMAGEIFSQLQSEKLTYAANLLSEQQLSDLTSWLISI